jgi:hypothetical protein
MQGSHPLFLSTATLIGPIVPQLNRLANAIAKRHPVPETLRPPPAAVRAVVHGELSPRLGHLGTRILADGHRGFTIDSHACDVLRCHRFVVFLAMLAKRASVSASCFGGVACITLRRRKPRRFSPAALVEGAGSWAAP